jgi:PhnB protein
MNRIEPYLTFNGNCEEALNFYKESLDGEITGVSRFGDAPSPASDEQKKKIMHATFKFGDSGFMASDTMIERPVTQGSNFALSVGSDDEVKTKEMFEKLFQGGQVTMPLAVQFWGDLFGMVKDKFGISWMLNCAKKK